MGYDPAIGAGRSPSRRPDPALNPERELRTVVRALNESAGLLDEAAEAVDRKDMTAALEEMARQRARAASTIAALASEAGVQVREDLTGGVGAAVVKGLTRLASGHTEPVVEIVARQEDQLVIHLDAALGGDLPESVKDQIRMTTAQVRHGLREIAEWD